MSVATTPRQVVVEQRPERNITWVDWGAAGTSMARDPDDVKGEYESLRRFLTSPEMVARLLAIEREGEQLSQQMLAKKLVETDREYRSREQRTRFARRAYQTEDEVPLPRWAWAIPAEARRSLVLILFDDRDPAQRAWVRERAAIAQSSGMQIRAICTGWANGADRDTFWRSSSTQFPVAPVAADELADFYGVVSYPAEIRMGADTMRVVQGLGQ